MVQYSFLMSENSQRVADPLGAVSEITRVQLKNELQQIYLKT